MQVLSSEPLARATVLLVEDDQSDAMLVQHRLRSAEIAYEVVHRRTLADALAYLENERVDVVLLDLGLPDTDGTNAVRAIRRRRRELPIVVLTGQDDERTGATALNDGAQDYLVKGEVTQQSLPRSLRYAMQRSMTEALRERLMHSDRLAAIGQLAAGVAHEVNNPAAFLLGNTTLGLELLDAMEAKLTELRETLVEKLGPDHAEIVAASIEETGLAGDIKEQREMLQDSAEGIDRIASVVRDLGSFARIQGAEVSLVDLNRVVEAACNLTRAEVRHRAALALDLGEIPTIVGHEARLTQLFVNLLLNAAHAIEVGTSAEHRVAIKTSATNDGQGIIVTVVDTGAGIPAERIDKIFEPFFTTKPQGKGTGLGLTLCAETARSHRGSIEVESTIGEGSTFTVFIPADTGLVADPYVPTPDGGTLVPQTGRILLIDDEPQVLKSMARILGKHHDLVALTDAKEALDELSSDAAFDVVFCDLMMPGLDGPAFYDHLEAHHPDMLERVVFVSGGAVTPRTQDFVRERPVTVLGKPMRPDRLRKIVSRIISEGRSD